MPSAPHRASVARSWEWTIPSLRRSISVRWRWGPMWPCNRRRSSSADTRTYSAALSRCANANLLAALRQARELAGATPGTLETFLAVRGARTLALRLERAQCNAMTLAERLARHPNVTLTRYPGLASHPTHAAARRQLKGFGTIISFDVRGGASAADAVCAGLQLIQHATSLGAVESTIERRASIPGQEHLPPALLRLSVGIEAVKDLWTDLDRALRNVAG